MVVEVNGADGSCCEVESGCDVNNLERASSLGAALDLNLVECVSLTELQNSSVFVVCA
jgi:hypothetical protein